MTQFFAQAAELTDRMAQGLDGLYRPTEDLETTIASASFKVVLYSALALLVLILASVVAVNRNHEKFKKPLFVAIAAIMALSTTFLIGSTVYLNVTSDSGGPVHWHADFEVWACGTQLEMREPTGTLSNKIGTSTLHEHNDQRIHLEGVVVEEEIDASLGKFFHVAGGAVTHQALIVPLTDTQNIYEDHVDGDNTDQRRLNRLDPGYVTEDNGLAYARFEDGQNCGDKTAEVQTFVYSYDPSTKTYTQTKYDSEEMNPRDYVIADDSNVPPGDCIIFEFDVPKEKTDKLCEQYGIRDIDRCAEFGVEAEKRDICQMRQAGYEHGRDYTTFSVSSLSGDESLEELEPVLDQMLGNECIQLEDEGRVYLLGSCEETEVQGVQTYGETADQPARKEWR